MKVLKPDHTRRIAIEGVPQPVRRPVDIDQSKTGFSELKTLRIYRFDAGSVIDGHAEEDEVFIIALSGAVELRMRSGERELGPEVMRSSVEHSGVASAAYLPPGGEYRLVAQTEADIAYARATPAGLRAPQFFKSHGEGKSETGAKVLLSELNHAEKLQLRLLQLGKPASFQLEGTAETLVYALGSLTAVSAEGEVALPAESTLALARSEKVTLRGSSEIEASVLVLTAREHL